MPIVVLMCRPACFGADFALRLAVRLFDACSNSEAGGAQNGCGSGDGSGAEEGTPAFGSDTSSNVHSFEVRDCLAALFNPA